MTDAYWKKRAQEMEHHEPAHKTQGKSLEDTLNGIPGLPPAAPAPGHPASNNREVDIQSALVSRIAAQVAQGQQSQQPHHQPSGGGQMVYLREGVQSYRELQGTNSPVTIAVDIGPTSGVVGKEFELRGAKKVYILEGHHQAVDLSNLDYSRVITLVEVKTAWAGNMLVPESAIMRQGLRPNQLLKG
jgi:hypothetical protein